MDKPAPSDYPIHELIQRRYSPRAFAPAEVSDADLASLIEAARWAPSCMNEQPWRFVVASRADPWAFSALLSCLDESNRRWADQAGALAFAIAKKTFTRNGKPNAYARYDTGQAVALLSVEATSRGLVVHQMAGFDASRATATLGLPADFEPVTAIALGPPGDPDQLPADLAERERAPRARKPQAELVFRGRFGA